MCNKDSHQINTSGGYQPVKQSHLSAKVLWYCKHFLIYMCQRAPFKALKQPAVQAANDVNRMMHVMLIYCLEQIVEEERCTLSAVLDTAGFLSQPQTVFTRSQLSQHLD